MPKVFIKTFGCQANKADSERILGDYISRGFSETSSYKNADQVVINTCSVRQSAEDRVRGLINNIVSHFDKIKSPRPKIILTGCMLHFNPKEINLLLPEVDEILPINEVGFNQPALRKDKTKAFVPISSGCNSFCTYCIVPYARGREKSRPIEEIVAEVQQLAKAGYKEIVLLGQNVNSFGLEKDGIGLRKMLFSKNSDFQTLPSNQTQYQKPEGTPPFVQLLQQIAQEENIEKISFFTSNPWDFYDSLIDEIAHNKKIDRFIHLPVQSGSNRILQKMNRGYTREDYLRLIDRIRSKVPDAVFGTDIIVGFPTETEEDFNQTLDLVKNVGFKVAFVARYSPRPGTVSHKLLPDDVPAKEKKRRWEILDKITNKDTLNDRPLVP